MKILHTSDWHLGKYIDAGRTYEDDQRYFFDRLYEIISNENIGAVIVAGDIYDSSVSNADAINLYNEVVTKICKDLGTPMIVIAGNHDSGPRLAACRQLLENSGLYVTGKISSDLNPVLLDSGRVAVYPVPFFSKEEVMTAFPDRKDEITSNTTAMNAVCSVIRENMDTGRKNIVAAHTAVVGAELSESDHSAQIGMLSAIPSGVFDGFDYTALGHIHKPQKVTEKVRYSGTPVRYSFGSEEKQTKGVYIIDTDDMSTEFREIPELHGRFTLEGTFDELMAENGHDNDYIRAVVTDKVISSEISADLRKKFPLLLEYRGLEYTVKGTSSSLSAEDVEGMDETAILIKFMRDIFDCEPDEEQLKLFREALEESDREVSEN